MFKLVEKKQPEVMKAPKPQVPLTPEDERLKLAEELGCGEIQRKVTDRQLLWQRIEDSGYKKYPNLQRFLEEKNWGGNTFGLLGIIPKGFRCPY
jgi:hypothetical protein